MTRPLHSGSLKVRLGRVFLTTGAIVAAGGSAARAQQYTVTDLGTLGHTISEAYDINDAGEIVGYATTFADGYWYAHAFRWRNGVMIDLGVLPGGLSSTAAGINSNGVICGFSNSAESTDRGFRWNQGGSITDIGTLGGLYCNAFDINDAGVIVGYSSTSNFDYYGFRWVNGQMTILQPFPGGPESRAEAINNLDQTVGISWPASGNAHAALWEADGSIVDLGTLYPGAASWAYAINDNSEVVGWGGIDRNLRRAFIWRDGEMESLGILPYDTYSEAYDINNDGAVVGFSWSGGHLDPGQGYERGFLWEHGVMYDLNELVTTGSTWWIRNARAINSNGQIVGFGNINGETHAFLMNPIPGTIAVTSPRPGMAGVANTIMTRGATPGARVDFVYGLAVGMTGVPGCPGVHFQINGAMSVGFGVANSDGVASVERNVPAAARNRAVYVQCVERSTCRVSNRVRYTFR